LRFLQGLVALGNITVSMDLTNKFPSYMERAWIRFHHPVGNFFAVPIFKKSAL
jgi:hypothetical protein